MRLAILGGGGFRTPLVHGALLRAEGDRRVTEVVLHDTDAGRLRAVARVLDQAGEGRRDAPRVRIAPDLGEALDGADFVFSAMRVGGLRGRTLDERIALDAGVLGQETTGAGGLAYGMRTVPVALDVAEQVRARCPDAWVINFTNPAGLVTQAMSAVLGDRVIGICDSPVSLARHALDALGLGDHGLGDPGLDLARARLDYAGLNHLGWLRGLHVDGEDVLPRLLADDRALASVEEARLFGADWVRTLGVLPNEYLYYYYFTREAVAGIREAGRTRGEFLLEQQTAFYDRVAATPDRALATWRAAYRERNETYLAELRDEGDERDAADVAGGGYEGVALALMRALAGDGTARLVLDVRNRGALPGLEDDALVEVPCTVTADGPLPDPVTPLRGHELGLVQQVKAAEVAAIAAATEHSPRRAVEALATHPLVDSVAVARRLVTAYRAAVPELDAALHGPR